MKLRVALAVPALLLVASAASRAAPADDQARAMLGFRVSMLCLAQDRAYETSSIGRKIASGEDFKGWSGFEAQPLVQCLRERKFLDKPLCDDLLAALDVDKTSAETTAALGAALARHEAAEQSALRVLRLEDLAGRSPDTFACPAPSPDQPGAADAQPQKAP